MWCEVLYMCTVVGAYDRQMFEFAMDYYVIPLVGSFAREEKCSILVMDNCNIRLSERMFNHAREKGGIVMFLPYVLFTVND